MQIRRFHVPNSDQVSHETIMGALDRGHFEPIALPLDERAEGFVNYDNPISQEWHLDEVIMGGQYARFALRIDQKKVDGKAVKVRLSELMVQDREEYKKAAEQLSLNPQHKPKKYRLSRDRKNELKRRAREEQVQKTPATPEYANVVWDLKDGIIYLLSTKAVFRKRLPSKLAMMTDVPAAQMTPPGMLEMLHLDPPVKPVGIAFLTWLWRFNEERKDELRDSEKKTFHVEFVDSITVEHQSEEKNGGKDSLTISGNLAESKELRAALDRGLMITSATLKFSRPTEASAPWKLTVQGWDFSMSLITPDQKKADDQAMFYETVALLQKPIEYFDALWTKFVKGQRYAVKRRSTEEEKRPLVAETRKGRTAGQVPPQDADTAAAPVQ